MATAHEITPAVLRQMAEDVFGENGKSWVSILVTDEFAFLRMQSIVKAAAVGQEGHPLHTALHPWTATYHLQYDKFCTKEFYSLWLCMLAAAVETGDL